MVENNIQINGYEKKTDFKEYNIEMKESTKQHVQSSRFSVILDGLARNKPILDVLSLACLILILAILGVIVCLLYGHSTSSGDRNTDKISVKLVTRSEWFAEPPRKRLEDLKLPVLNVIIGHTGTEECITKIECISMVRRIQNFHMAQDSKNFDDIGYHFLVGADGNAYEGRGWNKQGAHTKGYNQNSICIAFIGSFTDVEAPAAQIDAAIHLIAQGVENGKIDRNYRLYGQRQLAPVESPGRKLYERIKQWPNWSNQDNWTNWSNQ